MAASIETQRLISVSLGKIAQSRGQRGGINLHKNLLVATVLHKARTAYMMESYTYQQNLQRQKLQQEQLLQQQQQLQVPVQSESTTPVSVSNKAEEMCQAPSDSNLGQPSATPTGYEESRSVGSTGTTPESPVHEPMAVHQVNEEVTHDKENSPPVSCDRLAFSENVPTQESKIGDDHLAAASLLSQEAQLASEYGNSGKQQTLTSAATTCTGNVLKRRRDNPSACSQDYECPVSKKARVSGESYTSATYSDYTSDYSDLSSDESDSESDCEMMQISDSPQITNLVSIFNSGFSGLCAAVSKDSEHTSSEHQRDLDSSNSSSQSPSPVYSRRMSEPSLLCSTQVGRLETLPSAIILSA